MCGHTRDSLWSVLSELCVLRHQENNAPMGEGSMAIMEIGGSYLQRSPIELAVLGRI